MLYGNPGLKQGCVAMGCVGPTLAACVFLICAAMPSLDYGTTFGKLTNMFDVQDKEVRKTKPTPKI